MFNKLLDTGVNRFSSFMMKKYQYYPSATTAVLLVNVQKAFMAGQTNLTNELMKLLELARKNNFLVIYAPFGGSSQSNPSPAQVKLTKLLEGMEDGLLHPSEFVLQKEDLVLEPRHSLSAFNKTKLDLLLKSKKIEHIIAAGPYANLSLDSTIRDGVQLRYHLTILNSCVSSETEDGLKAFNITMPRYAQTVISLKKLESILTKAHKKEN